MRMLNLPINFVKFSIGSKQATLLAVAIVGVVTILLAGSILVVKRSSAHGANFTEKKQQGCCQNQSESPRRMIGAYYNTKDNWKSALVLNNKGPNPIAVTPILYSMDGKKFVTPKINLAGESAYKLYFGRLVQSAGPEFVEGSYEFIHSGRPLEVGASLRIVDEEKSLIFDEQLAEPGAKFSSDRAEVVYAIPYKSAKAVLILTNTTEKSFFVSGKAGDQSIDVNLGAHQTRIIDLQNSAKAVGSISLIQTGGGDTALLAMVHLSEPAKGFSIAVPFKDPLKAKSNQIQGAGLRLGKLHGGTLTPVIAVCNVGEAETKVSATIPLGRDGKINNVVLPQLSLAPGEMKLFDTSGVRWHKIDNGVTAGLEIKYTGAPGSVVASAMSVAPSGDVVFPLLMLDPQSISSSTGGYAWFAEDQYSTTVYVKNVTGKEQQFRLDIVYEQGIWGSNIKTLGPHETYAFDVRQIRDTQVKGSEGNTIPLDAESGHIYWTIFGSAEKALIGRAETLDPAGGMASTYECQTCTCSAATGSMSTGYYSGKVEPTGQDHAETGGTQNYRAMQQDVNCFGGPGSWFQVTAPIEWSTGDSNIATVNFFGTVTAQAEPGTTSVVARWTAYNQQWNPNNEFCDTFNRTGDGISSFTTQCSIPTGETFTSTGWADAFGIPTAALWMQTLTPSATNFMGRTVFETDASVGTDGCHFTGSAFDPQTTCCDSTNPDTWLVESGNKWGPDMVGWIPEGVNYYREARLTRGLPLSCQFTYQQRMFINCGTGGNYSPYVTTTLTGVIDVTTVSSGRNNNFVTKEWP